MPETIYDSFVANTSYNPNNVTVALALNGKKLTKIVYPNPDNDVDYDHAYYYKFFNRDVYCLSDILEYVRVLLNKKDCCLIRGIAKDDSLSPQRRLLHGNDATIIEQNQNWYALDVDNYGECSGDIKQDAKTVLLATGLSDVEAFAIPSSGYMRKPGIRIRLFLWNSTRISCLSLKKHFEKYNGVVDTALFHPIQPIYIARPIFSGCSDPCNSKMIVWITGSQMYTEIPNLYNDSNQKELLRTRKEAERFFNSFLREIFDIDDNRHLWLINRSSALGKWIGQGLLDENDTIEELYLATSIWRGDRKKDMQTIVDGIRRGKLKQEEENAEIYHRI